MKKFKLALATVLLSAAFQSIPLAICLADTKFTAVATSSATDFSSGAHITVTGESPRTLTEDLVSAGSDMTVVSKGKFFYRMERSGANNTTKFDINDPKTPVWQYSTEGSETGSNPHDLVFASDSLAYLLRYGSSRAWLVNTTASKQESFKVGELDFAAYADKDGKPEMNSGVIVGNKLFVTLQRIDFTGGWGHSVYNQAYVAVFNASTGDEITTGKGDDGLKGIALPLENPGSIQYVSQTGMIYIQCSGQYNKEYTGGIAVIDPENYESAILVDDGTELVHPYGAITGMVIVSPYKGYFVGYNGWGNNNLYKFNPASFTSPPVAISGFAGKNISGLEPTSLDKKGMVWVSTSDLDSATYNLGSPAIKIIDSGTDQVDQTINTKLVAQKFVFCDGTPGGGDSVSSDGGSCFISTATNMTWLSWCGFSLIFLIFTVSAVSDFVIKRRWK